MNLEFLSSGEFWLEVVIFGFIGIGALYSIFGRKKGKSEEKIE